MNEPLKQQLEALAEPAYRTFAQGLIPGCSNMIGVRLPRLRALAKTVADDADYWETPCGPSFEERMLRGMAIGYAAGPEQQRLTRIRDFVPLIDNWSVCDSFCTGLKQAGTYPAVYWDFLQPYLHSAAEFEVRFGVVMLLDHFVTEAWIDRVLEALAQVTHSGYYAKMAVGWAICTCYCLDDRKVWDWMKHTETDKEVRSIALQKIMQSRKVSGEARSRILRLRQQEKQQRK